MRYVKFELSCFYHVSLNHMGHLLMAFFSALYFLNYSNTVPLHLFLCFMAFNLQMYFYIHVLLIYQIEARFDFLLKVLTANFP
jgi:hypothetical protein